MRVPLRPKGIEELQGFKLCTSFPRGRYYDAFSVPKHSQIFIYENSNLNELWDFNKSTISRKEYNRKYKVQYRCIDSHRYAALNFISTLFQIGAESFVIFQSLPSQDNWCSSLISVPDLVEVLSNGHTILFRNLV